MASAGTITWGEAMEKIAEGMQAKPAVDIVPLKEAVYCMDCENISRRTQTGCCLVCSSESTLGLEGILNRDSDDEG